MARDLRGHAGPGVADLDHRVITRQHLCTLRSVVRVQRSIPRHNYQLATAGHRVACIGRQIGIGTTFRLYLRRADAGAEANGAVLPAAVVRGKAETVLAVEDNASLRRVVVRQLTELGYRASRRRTLGRRSGCLRANGWMCCSPMS